MPEIGDTVEGYRIDALIGRGGMGAVYEATQLSLDRTVALKVITGELSKEPAFRERFRREGLLQASLEHPHIVTVYEAGESEHGLFLAMRLIRGPNLKDLIVARQLDVGRTLRILAQAGDALDAAHEAGLIHRDIKPHNILVAAGRDHAYLADFGVTKAPGDRSLTRTGALVGTLDYISPEQIRGHRATSASDLYAFSCVLYECLTGVVPFPKDSDAAVLYAHVAEPPPLVTAHRPELPNALDGVLQRGMAKEPEGRPACAGDLIREVETALGETLSATIAAPGPLQSPEQAGIRRPAELTATPVLAGSATRPESPAPPTRLVPGSPAPETKQEYGVHWIGEQYTPAGEAAVATRAAPPAYTELAPTARRQRLSRLVVAGAAAAVIAVVAGFVIGGASADSGDEGKTAPVSAGKVSLSRPADWQRLDQIPTVLGTPLGKPLALAQSDQPGGGGLVAGTAPADAPTFVPASTQASLPASALGKPERVRVGGLEAFRYRNLVPSGFNGTLTLYALPQDDDVTLLGCYLNTGAPQALLRRCEEIVSTLELDGATAFPLAPTAPYAKALNGAITTLTSQRAAALRRLGRATKRSQQASAADDVAGAYKTAATRLGKEQVTPFTRTPNDALVSALTRAQKAYARLARDARAGSKTRYDAARAEIAKAQTQVHNALDGLRDIGFSFG